MNSTRKVCLLLVLSFLFLQKNYSQTLPNPVMFCTQIPTSDGWITMHEPISNHRPAMIKAIRGGDLHILYPNGTIKNLTQLAGYGNAGMQGENAIAVRDPHIHWSGTKALFSMVVGGTTEQYTYDTFFWQMYEVTGLGVNDTPVITLVANQPNNYNNVGAIYGTDERIIFESDRPRGGQAHLYPQHDEYESTAIVTGLWKINPNACSGQNSLEMMTHSPSGDFTPILDSYGRIVFTRWDHLKRDQQASADFYEGDAYGTFNYTDESADALKYANDPEIEFFPEPLDYRDDLFALPEWMNSNPYNLNIFSPWMINEDGTELETLNHIGRHESKDYVSAAFNNDSAIFEFAVDLDVYVGNMFHIVESPVTPGLYYGTDAPEFGTHSSGMIFSMYLPPTQEANNNVFNYITHPYTRTNTEDGETPSAEHTGLYRQPLPLTDGNIIVSHTSESYLDYNEGTGANPLSLYDFRLKYLEADGVYLKGAATNLTGAGITKSISYWSPDVRISYSGLLWETHPVEIVARAKPANSTLNALTVSPIEQSVFDQENVDVATFQNFLKRNDLALVISRNVTSRDTMDKQQPYNLKVWGSTTQTTDPAFPNSLYEVKYLQFMQGDQIRGIGGISTPEAGRRVIAQYMHDETAMQYNLSTTGAQGSVNIATDGSIATIVPANRALTWQLTDNDNSAVVRERVWLSFVPGEIRTCSSCHGENRVNQAGLSSPENPPLALNQLLSHIKTIDSDSDNIADWLDFYPNDPSGAVGEALNEGFVHQLSAWTVTNPDNDEVEWTSESGDNCNGDVAVINNRLVDNTGTTDELSQSIDLSVFSTASLQFDVAYARFDATHFDALKVEIIDCNTGNATLVYHKTGIDLATAPDQNSLFSPADCSEWRTECIDLSAFVGMDVELVFKNIGAYGNKLFIDNISITEEDADMLCDTSVDTDMLVDKAEITIYPNPTADVLTIRGLTGDYEVQIIDVTGAVCQTLNGNNVLNVDISKLPSGLYFVSISQVGSPVMKVEKILKI